MQCIVVTPETTLRDAPADFVAVTLFDGEVGIAPGHTPLIGRLGCGELRIKREDKVERYYIEGGFVEVTGDVVSVLTGKAIRAESLDEEVALEQFHAAQGRKATNAETAAQRDAALAAGRAQLRVVRKSRG